MRGAKRAAEKYGIDFRDFLKNGIDAQVLLNTGDGQARKVVENKRNANVKSKANGL